MVNCLLVSLHPLVFEPPFLDLGLEFEDALFQYLLVDYHIRYFFEISQSFVRELHEHEALSFLVFRSFELHGAASVHLLSSLLLLFLES